jgi:hypothetical protein
MHLGYGSLVVPEIVVDIMELVVEADVEVSVTMLCMISDIDAVALRPPPVPATAIAAVVEGAVADTSIESVEVTLPPGGGVTGLSLNPPEMTDGS